MKPPKRNNAVGPQVRAKAQRRSPLVPALAVTSLVAGASVATQICAHDFRYQSVLGESFHGLYKPWAIFQWYSAWGKIYSAEFTKSLGFGGMVSALGLIANVLYLNVKANSSRTNEYLHGSARWADWKDISAASLVHNDGVYVGSWVDQDAKVHYLRHNGPEHVLTYAPTRSGKGVGLVIPTLLSWGHSLVATDLKGELWSITAGWRKAHGNQYVLRFEPAALEGCARWNPLDEIRVGTEYEVADVQNLATLIVNPDGKDLDHWGKTARSLLVGLILHTLYRALQGGPSANMAEVDRLLTDPSRPVKKLWKEMIGFNHYPDRAEGEQTHPIIAASGRDMMNRPDEEAGSVISTASSYLDLYRDPVVTANTSVSDFCINDLMNRDKPVSLYIITQPTDKDRLRPLVRIMLDMIVRKLAPKQTFENGRVVATYKHRLLFMIDEFPALGKLPILQESLAFAAGYGLKFYLICQDINQLRSRETGYGPDELITSNCHVQNAYPPNRLETAQHLSKLTGQTTVINEQITTSGKRFGGIHGQVTRTQQAVQRPLLTDDECIRMPGPKKDANGEITEAGDMLIYTAGFPMIYGRQPLYFKDPVFSERSKIPPPKASDVLSKLTPVAAPHRSSPKITISMVGAAADSAEDA
ncbi:type IV secretory system conjugative DNA transfer family protein [Novosphingobium terrae]|uniref:type IV secretory system conjugative DNA transfer family protein n=1 Tax=Novosphingobium terrae TaxID=2726189 RepID=UPI001981518F|nr:type IV secretory system conjugative DNA transfer family protein [Novosphingobium terrae]